MIKHRREDGSTVYITHKEHAKLARKQFSPYSRGPFQSRTEHVLTLGFAWTICGLALAAAIYRLWTLLP